MTRILRGAALGFAALLALSACGGSDKNDNPLDSGGSTKAGSVVVGSANFPESQLLAEIYAQALEAKGVQVTKKLNIGTREAYYPQLQSGGLTVFPEYNGALLAYLDKTAKATTTEAVNQELATKLPASLKLLDSAKAEDKDSVTVTQATAQKYHLKTLADLAPVAKDLVIGGPPEFKTRLQGLLGLKSVYGADFKQFKSLDVAGPITVAALKKGDVQAANLFTTDPSVLANNFVVLEDPKNLFGAQNVTPVVNASALTDQIRTTLNGVSAKLDTAILAELDKKVISDKDDADQVAGDWLKSVGLA